MQTLKFVYVPAQQDIQFTEDKYKLQADNWISHMNIIREAMTLLLCRYAEYEYYHLATAQQDMHRLQADNWISKMNIITRALVKDIFPPSTGRTLNIICYLNPSRYRLRTKESIEFLNQRETLSANNWVSQFLEHHKRSLIKGHLFPPSI